MDNSIVAWGISLAVISGLMNGTFTLPMRYLGRWSWENVWTVFITVACLVMPVAILFTTVSHPLAVLSAAPTRAELIAIATGFMWGFGAVMFGQGVSALGISMANTLVLAISASLGSFLPILILAPERLRQPQGEFIMLGTVVAMAALDVAVMREFFASGAKSNMKRPHAKWSARRAPCGPGFSSVPDPACFPPCSISVTAFRRESSPALCGWEMALSRGRMSSGCSSW